MRRGTTPTVAMSCDVDLTGWNVYLTFAQEWHVLTVTDVHVTPVQEDGKVVGCVVSAVLSQDDTLGFRAGDMQVQVRACKDGMAIASQIVRADVKDVIFEEVIG